MYIDEKDVNSYIKKIKIPVCPLCGKNNWTISNQVFQVIEYRPDEVSKSLPVIPLACINCGNTYLINTLVAKLTAPENEESKSEPIESSQQKGD